jgi:hypothetical protein
MSAGRAFATTARGIAATGALGLGLLAARGAGAQPNPFDDYERFMAGAPPAAAQAARTPVLKTEPLTWSLGLGAQVSFSRLTYERGGDAQDGEAMTLLFRILPSVNVFVTDRIQVGVSPGLMVRSGGNSAGDDAADANMLIEATGRYFIPLSPRISFVPGVGIGGYFGSGSRWTNIVVSEGTQVRADLDTETSGFAMALYLGIAYQLDERLQLRAGLAGNAFFGADKLEGRSSTLSSTATHIGLPIELFYGF